MGRMTKTSKANLLIADRCGFGTTLSGGYVGVWVERDGNRAYLHDGDGPLLYPSVTLARRAVRRIRPDLEPVTI